MRAQDDGNENTGDQGQPHGHERIMTDVGQIKR